MKAINNIYKTFSWLFILLMLMTACENDGDKIYLSSIESSDFVVTESNVKLSKETSTAIVLSLAWTKNSFLAVSDPSMSTAATVSYYIQISTTNDFSSNVVETLDNNFSKAYTGVELWSIFITVIVGLIRDNKLNLQHGQILVLKI